MGVLEVQAPGGKDLVVSLCHTVAATGMQVATSQVLIPWMDLMDPAGGEKM